VFDVNHFHGVNSSIWTIPLEIKCYAYLAVAGLLGFMRVRLFPIVLILGIGYWYFFRGYFFNGVGADMPDAPRVLFIEFGLAFAYGAAMYSLRDVWETRRFLCSCIVLLTGIGFGLAQHPYIAVLAVLPFFVVVFGEMKTPFLRRFGRCGDLSYGMYIYAFMTQQTISALTGNVLSLWPALIVSTACTALLAFVSWHLIEEPTTGLKRFLGKGKARGMTVGHSNA
jgi:peptidoglycan/LPS O-acetylase OafA/YrhL